VRDAAPARAERRRRRARNSALVSARARKRAGGRRRAGCISSISLARRVSVSLRVVAALRGTYKCMQTNARGAFYSTLDLSALPACRCVGRSERSIAFLKRNSRDIDASCFFASGFARSPNFIALSSRPVDASRFFFPFFFPASISPLVALFHVRARAQYHARIRTAGCARQISRACARIDVGKRRATANKRGIMSWNNNKKKERKKEEKARE